MGKREVQVFTGVVNAFGITIFFVMLIALYFLL